MESSCIFPDTRCPSSHPTVRDILKIKHIFCGELKFNWPVDYELPADFNDEWEAAKIESHSSSYEGPAYTTVYVKHPGTSIYTSDVMYAAGKKHFFRIVNVEASNIEEATEKIAHLTQEGYEMYWSDITVLL